MTTRPEKPRLWSVRIGRAEAVVGPCTVGEMLELLDSWGRLGDNRFGGDWGYMPAELRRG